MTHIFAEQLKAEGFQAGLPETTLRAQFNEMRREGSPCHEILRTICVDLSISEARKQYRELRDQIEDSACFIGISLHLKVGENQEIAILKGPRHIRRKRLWQDNELGDENSDDDRLEGVLGHFVSSESETDDGMLHSRCRKRLYSEKTGAGGIRTQLTDAQLPSPNSNRSGFSTPATHRKGGTSVSKGKAVPLFRIVDESGNKHRRIPRLLYRWYSTQSQGLNTPTQLRAGKFVDAKCKIPKPEWDVESISNHLIPEKRPSPFISFRDDMRPCMVHAVNADEASNARITVIDLQKFLTASHQQWGDDSAARPCASFVKRLGLKVGRWGKYTGSGEWLLYGTVEREAIITTIRISDILMYVHSIPRMDNILQIETLRAAQVAIVSQRRLWRSAPPMDFQTGMVVGSFAKFLRIPHTLLEEFCATLAVSWALQGSRKSKPNKKYDEFMNGVFSIEGTPERSEVSSNNIVEGVLTDEESDTGNMSDTSDTREVSYSTPPDEQDLIDIQIQRELSSDLKRSNAALGKPITTSANYDNVGSMNNDVIDGTAHSPSQSQFKQSRSSSLFHFKRPRIPGPPTDWDMVNNRDVSPAPMERSALDTFTTELLAKAEECSTTGSFGRGPSTSSRRETSEVEVVMRTRKEDNGHNSMERPADSVIREGPDVIELLSDDGNDDDDVQEMDFVILAARKLQA